MKPRQPPESTCMYNHMLVRKYARKRFNVKSQARNFDKATGNMLQFKSGSFRFIVTGTLSDFIYLIAYSSVKRIISQPFV